MSGNIREVYEDRAERSVKSFSSGAKGLRDREERIKSSRATMGEKKVAPRRVLEDFYDESKVRKGITKPKPGVKRIHIVQIDNSGSNRTIAKHLKQSSGYLTAVLKIIDPESQIAFDYVSDHCDGKNLSQQVDYVSPDKEGDATLVSTISHVSDAHGGDEAEAFECTLNDACELDFGDAEEKHLYLVTDVVAHGMGMSSDEGCPKQGDWKKTLKKVAKTFTTFEVVGCANYPENAALQKKFFSPDRVEFDLIDVSSIKETYHRMAITGNALLFLIARKRGKQAVEAFLGFLYEKWLEEPIFGLDSDKRAKEMIRRFGKYLEWPEKEIEAMMKKVLAE